MIDKDVFLKEMSLLEARFGRTIEDAVFNGYYEILSEKLDNQQFSAACKRVFAEEDFFPSPNKFLQKVQANTEDLAVLEWEWILRASASGHSFIGGLTPTAEKALKAIGGLRAVGMADLEFAIPRMRKEFIASYKAHSSTAVDYLAALSSASDERNQIASAESHQGVGDDLLPPEELSKRIRAMMQKLADQRGLSNQSKSAPHPVVVASGLDELGKAPKSTLADEIKQKNEWLKSGDRILESEAIEWANEHPDVVLKWNEYGDPNEIVEKSVAVTTLSDEEPF